MRKETYKIKCPNLILTQHFSIGWDGYRHKHNTNVLVVGGSGAGKHGATVCRTYWKQRAETKCAALFAGAHRSKE